MYRGWGTATPAWVTYIRARWLWFQRDETLQPGSVRAHFWPRSVRNRVGSRALRVNALSLKLHRLALCPLANRRGRAGCAVYSEDGTVLLLCSGGKRPDRSSGQESAHLCFRPPPRCYVSWWHLRAKSRRAAVERRPTETKQTLFGSVIKRLPHISATDVEGVSETRQ